MDSTYDAILLVSFGGPEGPDDVLPFLENVLQGKNVPRERMLTVAEHYYQFGGVSPINEQNRQLIDALRVELKRHGPNLPIYWGNRNWQPYLPDALAQMRDDGVKRALAFFTSVYSSYSGCRQYRENIAAAREQVEGAPEVDKVRVFFNHPGYIEACADKLGEALDKLPPERRSAATVVYCAHSIPDTMAANCRYAAQFEENGRLVSEHAGVADWRLAYQSRSGPPSQPWLEPDVNDLLEEIAKQKPGGDVIVHPIGFISDHMEVLFDLDTEAKETAQRLGLNFVRAATVGVSPRFVRMVRELIEERIYARQPRPALGQMPASHDVCPIDCCKYEPRRPAVANDRAGQNR